MRKEKKKGFHITITDLTSGKTIIDADQILRLYSEVLLATTAYTV